MNFKKFSPYLLALALFILIPLIYFSPLLEGKVLSMGDITQWKGMAAEVVKYNEDKGEQILWTNSMFSGMPAYQISVEMKKNLLRYVDKVVRFLPRPADYLFLLLLSFYILLLVFRVNPWLSIVGAIAFAFSSYNFIIIEAGHTSKVHAIAYMPLVLAGVILLFRRRYILGGALTAFAAALEIYTNHFQITYYLFILLLIYGIVKLVQYIKAKETKPLAKIIGILLIAAVLSIAANITRLWTTWEYANETIRGGTSELSERKKAATGGLDKDYAMAWSYGIGETMTLIFPNYRGGSSHYDLGKNSEVYNTLTRQGAPPKQAEQYAERMPAYWGDQPFTSGPVYMGSVVVLLFLIGIFLVKGPVKWWLVIGTILSIFLAWGKNFEMFTDLFFYYFPMYNKFRTPSMIFVIAQVTIPLLGFLALRNIIQEKVTKADILRAFKFGAITLGAFWLITIVFGEASFSYKGPADAQLPGWLIDALQNDRKSMMWGSIFRSFIFMILASVLLFFFINKKIRQPLFFSLLGLLIISDMWWVNKQYLNNDSFVTERSYEQEFRPTQADLQIKQDPDPHYRVLNLSTNTFNDALTSYHHKSIGGYHAAKLIRYQELIEHHISKNNRDVMNMLNTKYFILPTQDRKNITVQRNPKALGNAWFVENIKWVNNADEEIAALNDFTPANTAVIDKRFQDVLGSVNAGKSGSIRLVNYHPDHMVYESNAPGEQFAVFSEVHYNSEKGWQAYVDGEPVPHVRVNYTLRGMKIPAGQHKIEFKFEPKSFYVGSTVSLISSGLVILLFLGALFWKWRGRTAERMNGGKEVVREN